MHLIATVILGVTLTFGLSAQTAEELVANNLRAKGGVDKIKALRTLRISGRIQAGGFTALLDRDAVRPDLLRETFTIQGMSQIRAYDGAIGWQISPFEGRKDPELLGEDDLRDLREEADFFGPLVDYKEKGSKVEYLGHDLVDGDDAYRLKLTLLNGDIIYYYLDPDTCLEIRTEKLQFIRGSVRQSSTDLGSYKLVEGVYFPFSMERWNKQNPGARVKITIDKIEANDALNTAEFKMPSTATSGHEF